MNICFLMTNVYAYGGIERVSKIIAEKLSAVYHVSIVSVFSEGCNERSLNMKVPVRCLCTKNESLKNVIFKCSRKLRKMIREEKIDVLVSTSENVAPICWLATACSKVPYICWFHSNPDVKQEYSFQGACRFLAVKTAARRVVLAEGMKKNFREAYKKDYFVIRNPIEEELFCPVSYDESSRRIITVGRLTEQKNYKGLVSVAEKVLKLQREWQWDIYGDGELYDEIQSCIEKTDVAERIHLMGNVSDLYIRYPKYAFQVMTSFYEGYPMTLLEAMASGMPMIAYDVETGPNEIIRDGKNGFLIPFEEKDAMADKILQLIENDQLRKEMSDYCCSLRWDYGIDAVIREWRALLDGLTRTSSTL